MNEEIKQVFDHWNSHEGAIHHRKMTKAMERAILKHLQDGYKVADLKEAISNYSKIVTGKQYFWTCRWSITHFFVRRIKLDRTHVDKDYYQWERWTTNDGFHPDNWLTKKAKEQQQYNRRRTRERQQLEREAAGVFGKKPLKQMNESELLAEWDRSNETQRTMIKKVRSEIDEILARRQDG